MTIRCLTCKHCYIDFGSPGYSDVTPGSPGHWGCRKYVWNLGDYDGKEDLEKAFEQGETCVQWESDGRHG